MSDLLLRRVRPHGGAATDVLIRGGRIAAIGPQTQLPAGVEAIDGGGELLLPGFVDGHVHLDKILWGLPWRRHSAGPTLAELIANERRERHAIGVPVAERAGNLIRQMVAKGTTHIRSHVDIDPEIGLGSLEGVFEARETYRDAADIQLVAFPQQGVMVEPGTVELLEAAVQAGAELIGGLDPAGFDLDPKGQLDAVFGIAGRHGCGVDIHLHDGGELGALQMRMIAERTRALGLQGRVAISHGFALGMIDEALFAATAERLAAAGISIMTSAPGARAMPPIKRLLAAGINVFLGNDALRDLWTPYGNGDLLERMMLAGWRSNFRRDEDVELMLELGTVRGAQALGIADYGLEPGRPADLVLVPGETVAEAIVSRPERTLVLKRGRIVARGGRFVGTV